VRLDIYLKEKMNKIDIFFLINMKVKAE